MRQVLGEASVKMIYKHMERVPCLRLEEVAEKPEVFSSELGRLLGSRALLIEMLILKKLYSKLELKFVGKEG